MPSDVNGNYSLPAGYLATTGETIEASQHNPPLEDLASAMSARLPRNGAAAMTGPLKLSDGNGGAPALTFGSNTAAGFYKHSSGGFVATTDFVGGMPLGAVIDYAGLIAPTGWLFCYGQLLLIASYSALASVIGGTYNTGGEPVDSFRMPDLRDVVVAGKGNMGGSDRGILTSGTTLGGLLGAQSITLDATMIPAHLHPVNITTGDDSPDHAHTGGQASSQTARDGPGTPALWFGSAANTGGATSRHQHLVNGNTGNTGGGAAHSNVQPTSILNKIMFSGV